MQPTVHEGRFLCKGIVLLSLHTYMYSTEQCVLFLYMQYFFQSIFHTWLFFHLSSTKQCTVYCFFCTKDVDIYFLYGRVTETTYTPCCF